MANITTTLQVTNKDSKTGIVSTALANDVKELLQNDIRINSELTTYETNVANALKKL